MTDAQTNPTLEALEAAVQMHAEHQESLAYLFGYHACRAGKPRQAYYGHPDDDAAFLRGWDAANSGGAS